MLLSPLLLWDTEIQCSIFCPLLLLPLLPLRVSSFPLFIIALKKFIALFLLPWQMAAKLAWPLVSVYTNFLLVLSFNPLKVSSVRIRHHLKNWQSMRLKKSKRQVMGRMTQRSGCYLGSFGFYLYFENDYIWVLESCDMKQYGKFPNNNTVSDAYYEAGVVRCTSKILSTLVLMTILQMR